jgi:threonine synthase
MFFLEKLRLGAVKMRLVSTSTEDVKHSFRYAVAHGLTPKDGLFMPENLIKLSKDFFKKLHKLSFQDISVEVLDHLLEGDVSRDTLEEIVYKEFSFAVPVVPLSPETASLELFHGPTCAFKDFGARAMAGIMTAVRQPEDPNLTILVATSGDTGGAVAHSFFERPHFRVIVLYPKGKVSEVQEKQFTTLGKNILAVEVDGTFDDCQRLVKQAFQDKALNERVPLSSANSINLARLLPQSCYYFFAHSRYAENDEEILFSIPSGNFGNITAGLIARRLGLPIKHLIAGTNVNRTVPEYLETGIFSPKPGIMTISNAMDVGAPNNFPRLTHLTGGTLTGFKDEISAYSFNDEETLKCMHDLINKYDYVVDPHGAIGFMALEKYRILHSEDTARGIFLHTAHPAKFASVVEPVAGNKLKTPQALIDCLIKEKVAINISANFSELRKILLWHKW